MLFQARLLIALLGVYRPLLFHFFCSGVATDLSMPKKNTEYDDLLEQLAQLKPSKQGSLQDETFVLCCLRVYGFLRLSEGRGHDEAARYAANALGTSHNSIKERLKEYKTNNGVVLPAKRARVEATNLSRIPARQIEAVAQSVEDRRRSGATITVPTLTRQYNDAHPRDALTTHRTRRILKKYLQLSWLMAKSGRIITDAILALRRRFLNRINQARDEDRTIVYTDESYLHTNHNSRYIWTSKQNRARGNPSGSGRRMIILSAGTKDGELRNTRKTRWASDKNGDYHGNVDHKLYEKWFSDVLLPEIPGKAAIVLDNASYHKRRDDSFPFPQGRTYSNLRRAECLDYCEHHEIPTQSETGEDLTVKQLKERIYAHRDSLPFVLQKLIGRRDITLIFQPPYHPDVQATEEIWGAAKNKVAHRRGDKFDKQTAQRLFDTAMDEVEEAGIWAKAVEHAQQAEAEYADCANTPPEEQDPLNAMLLDGLVEDLEDEESDEEEEEERTRAVE